MATNNDKYDLSDYDKFESRVSWFCQKIGLPFELRVTKKTLKHIHECGLASAFTYACEQEHAGWVKEKCAREFTRRKTYDLPDNGVNGSSAEEHF